MKIKEDTKKIEQIKVRGWVSVWVSEWEKRAQILPIIHSLSSHFRSHLKASSSLKRIYEKLFLSPSKKNSMLIITFTFTEIKNWSQPHFSFKPKESNQPTSAFWFVYTRFARTFFSHKESPLICFMLSSQSCIHTQVLTFTFTVHICAHIQAQIKTRLVRQSVCQS